MTPTDTAFLKYWTDAAITRLLCRAVVIRDADVLLELDLCPTDEQARVIRGRIEAWRKRIACVGRAA